jgi:glyoxylase-like metal-dependent hydrolase (beta-lactamase superfamily II)
MRLAALLAVSLVASTVGAQTNPYNAGLLREVRARARAIPGPLPVAVRYVSVLDDSTPTSELIEGAPHTRIFQVTPVFQVRYPDGWIMVDAGFTREQAGKQGHFSAERFAEAEAALRGAGLIVVTHEHPDHVGTLVESDIMPEVAPHTLLTREQVEAMEHKPWVFIRLDTAQAHRYLIVDYDRLLPIAPGVVLIRAPGHTPGSQMVYVRLASGRELILAGDVAWLKQGIDEQRQKPDSTSRQLHEDRHELAEEMAWLKNTVESAGVTVVISHDGDELSSLDRRGILTQGLDSASRRTH